MKKKLLALVLVVVLALTSVIGGTMAYLTDTEENVNVMIFGNVDIKQLEYERVIDETGKPVKGVEGTDFTSDYGITESYKLQEFTQGKPAYPAVYTNEAGTTAWDEFQQLWNQVGAPGSNDLFDDSMKNVVDKFVFVKNTGKTDAYYRTIIAIESPEEIDAKLIHINFNSNSRFDAIEVSSDFTGDADKGTKSYHVGYITVDDVRYSLYNMTYNQILTPGEVSRPSLLQVYLDPSATNEDCAAFGDTWEILVVSQAVQTAGFEDAGSALNEAFGDITTTNHPWVGATVANEIGITEAGTYNLTGDVYTIDSTYFHTQNATGPVTINGNGAVVEGVATSVDAFQWEGGTIPYMSAIFASEGKTGSLVTVNDLTFSGTMSAVMAGMYVDTDSNWFNTEFNNVDIVDAEVVSFSGGISPALAVYGNFTMNNCNVYGTALSKLDTDPMWPVYDMAIVNGSNTAVNDSTIGTVNMWAKAKIALNNSTVESITVRGNMNTNAAYGIYVNAGSTVDVIDLSAVTNSAKVNITVAEGGSVGAYVDNGVSYETLDAWKAAQ